MVFRGFPLQAVLSFFVLAGCQHEPSSRTGETEGGDSDSESGSEPPFPNPNCVEDVDCQSPSDPVCSMGVCTPCMSDSDCEEVEGGNFPDCIGGSCAVVCSGNDSYELNNSAMTATGINKVEDVTNAWLCPGDQDWYEFQIMGAHYVSIIANYDAYAGIAALELLDVSSNVLDSSSVGFYGASVPRGVQAIHTRLEGSLAGPATYRLRVSMAAGAGELPYRLTLISLEEG